MLATLIVLYLAHLVSLVIAQNKTFTTQKGYNITFDDLNNSTQDVIPMPTRYGWLSFHSSWQVARNGSSIPFTPHSSRNAVVMPPAFNNATAEFSTACPDDCFDIQSLWIIACWVNPRYFRTDEACIITFTGTTYNGTEVVWTRPVRKTTMEIVQFSTNRGFNCLKKLRMDTRFEFGNGTAGRIGVDEMILNRRVGGNSTC